MPPVANLRAQDEKEGGDVVRPFDIRLYLPSALAATTPCDPHLAECEWSLREAQALDALGELRQYLLCRSHLWYDRAKNVRGQRQGTRSWSALDTLKQRIDTAAARYRAACEALSILSKRLEKGEAWMRVYKVLQDGDIKGLTVKENEGTEGTLITTWIWKVAGLSTENSDELQEGAYPLY